MVSNEVAVRTQAGSLRLCRNDSMSLSRASGVRNAVRALPQQSACWPGRRVMTRLRSEAIFCTNSKSSKRPAFCATMERQLVASTWQGQCRRVSSRISRTSGSASVCIKGRVCTLARTRSSSGARFNSSARTAEGAFSQVEKKCWAASVASLNLPSLMASCTYCTSRVKSGGEYRSWLRSWACFFSAGSVNHSTSRRMRS